MEHFRRVHVARNGTARDETGREYASLRDATPSGWKVVVQVEDLDRPKVVRKRRAQFVTYPVVAVVADPSRVRVELDPRAVPSGAVPVLAHHAVWAWPSGGVA